MDLNEYQRRAATTAIYPGKGGLLGSVYAALGLLNEAGEVLDKLLDFAAGAGAFDPAVDAAADVYLSELGAFVAVAKDAGRIKKMVRDGNATLGIRPGVTLPPGVRLAVAYEVADALWYVAAVGSELDAPLSDVAAANLDKLASRQARGTLGGSGDDR